MSYFVLSATQNWSAWFIYCPGAFSPLDKVDYLLRSSFFVFAVYGSHSADFLVRAF